ncbi:hypothetical protein JCGZ_26210 [Jatropha curcas]|uniref:Hydroxyproline-rich glycoprotein family protein n=1 Tax=Jatropha curcas TaxID=180498 RepID=A0A067JS57_JATCU|nr:uncharacterized protein LOC105648566 [Jatropha curcas]KDP22379.1 hypothetical protein JCGZ_26210 [Jatropha curcas]
MAENEAIGPSQRKYIRQPPSVPFLWEERPGVAKKGWRPVVSSVTTLALPSPVKLVASVPFNWEEKPGKPLPCFSEPPPESALLTSPSPPMYSQSHNDEYSYEENGGNVYHGDKGGIFDLDIESFSFETEDSLSSAPSLLANCLVSSVAVSSAVPVPKTSSSVDINDQFEIASSPASESDDSTNSYATGRSSLAGASFLECLFPLYSPSSGFLEKHTYSKNSTVSPSEVTGSRFDYESGNTMAKKPPTLGELIMMSRRRSHQRKAVQMGKQNLSMEFINNKAFGCCLFGAGIRIIEGSQRKRHHLLRLKLI